MSTAAGHVPVMLAEVLSYLAPHDGGIYADATFGGGGYARAILDAADCTVIGIDRDPDAIARGAVLQAQYGERLELIESRFGSVFSALSESGRAALDGAVFDLGVSSFQLDQSARGFSFREEGPLDMRMGADGPTAADLIRDLDEATLADIIWRYGEERLSRRVARAIVAARAEAPITTTGRLASIVRAVVPAERPRPGGARIDPATRTFQALRIAVNDELGEIEQGLNGASRLLGPGGRLVVVAFHSLEDRIVKRFMAAACGRAPAPSRHDPRGLAAPASPPVFDLLTPRAVRPGAAETEANPRARSARLRAMRREGAR